MNRHLDTIVSWASLSCLTLTAGVSTVSAQTRLRSDDFQTSVKPAKWTR